MGDLEGGTPHLAVTPPPVVFEVDEHRVEQKSQFVGQEGLAHPPALREWHTAMLVVTSEL